jgi:serine/threonine protein phosphatase PrpC
MQGWRVSMEDAKITDITLDTDTTCFGVFDGHGGKEVAAFVSRHFSEYLVKNTSYQAGRYPESLCENFVMMDSLLGTPSGNKEIIRIMRNLPDDAVVNGDTSDSMAGCTAVVALIKGTQLFVANAGDSRCVLARKGKAIEMSRDHKPELPSERERIYRAGGFVEDGRVMGNLNLSRSIGDLEYKKNTRLQPQDQIITAYPEVNSESIDSGTDFMVLACDGVWDVLTSQQCIDFIYERLGQKPLSNIVEDILDRCLATDISSSGGLGCDNMTCVVVTFNHTS